ncbi:hypothetical protein RI054_07g39810 [Pseudoscourfieldia marina]
MSLTSTSMSVSTSALLHRVHHNTRYSNGKRLSSLGGCAPQRRLVRVRASSSPQSQSQVSSVPKVSARRRITAIAELTVDVSLACACEVFFRPQGTEGCTNAADCVASLLPEETQPQQRQKALDAIKIGDDALERRDFAAADDAYTEAVEAAPTLYTAAQKALTKRAEARRCGAKPGYKVDCTGTGYTPPPNDGLIKDEWRVWLWGRGVRWPGHYIIALLIIRQLFVPDGGFPMPRTDEEKSDSNRRGVVQGVIAITVLFAYNVALFNYGLTY